MKVYVVSYWWSSYDFWGVLGVGRNDEEVETIQRNFEKTGHMTIMGYFDVDEFTLD